MAKNSKVDGKTHSQLATDNKQKKELPKSMASLTETFRFVFECGTRVQVLFVVGFFSGIANGLVFPALAYLYSKSFSNLSSAAANGLDQITQLAYTFMVVGVFALSAATVQGWAFEIVAFHASQNFRLKWFQALLRQDQAFFDVYDVGGMAGQIGPNANKFRHGVGRKFGEGIQFLVTGIGGIVFALYSSWQVALVVLAAVPLVSVVAMMLMRINQNKGTLTAQSYKKAGGVAYSAVSSVKTVLSLNAVKEIVSQYTEATQQAYRDAISFSVKQGLATGSMLGTFIFFYVILILFGSFILYRQIRSDGCDPSGGVKTNDTCGPSAAGVFGSMLGILFAAQGVSQVGNVAEALAAARVAVSEALTAINRTAGVPEQVIYKESEDDLGSSSHSKRSSRSREAEEAEKEVKAILPRYEIDATSIEGAKPRIKGSKSFKNVHFSYPTRPGDPVLQGLTLDIKAGDTVALVGPSGGGKSTVVSMLERFYDPSSGSIILDGHDLKDINLAYLRRNIGYVGQEPTLFATTIRGNIQYGNPRATQEIEAAARLANAHDFIMAFPDGYDTQVGDKGSQLSGGQKQRIAIARVLVGNPRLLILDEATSALDAESELVVQEAVDNIMEQKQITTVIIAHRLSTIRNADVINVIVSGQLWEQGTHEELMLQDSYYRRLVEKQEGVSAEERSLSQSSSRRSSEQDLAKLGEAETIDFGHGIPHIEFKGVSFSYPARPSRTIFDDFNLVIHQGETVALVGPSGGGKSTTVGLVERFYDPTKGDILYLGTDLRSLNVSWYRSQLAYVGQEPVLFNMSIAENIAFGAGGVTRAEIEEEARQANAHDFIVEFPEGYETPVGSRGTQLSGGQKQRVAIARALVRKPRVLILDEATSALDNESEAIVQEAIDRLMDARDHTVIVIAHRLSTIRNADRIAYVSEGKVMEYGTHDDLINRPHGRYHRLFESSKRESTVDSVGLRRSSLTMDQDKEVGEDAEEEINWEKRISEEEEKAFDGKRARKMASPDVNYLLLGSIGAVLAGGVFPVWGVLFSETINLLFNPVLPCPDPLASNTIPGNFATCQDYYDSTASDMRSRSFEVAGYWAILLVGCVVGNMLTFVGFGTASERLNKRVRDSSFLALMRQEVAFFDMRSVGHIASQLQDDAARIHAFSGEPIRSLVVALTSVVTGVVLGFVFMWPFALVAIGCIPLMGFALSTDLKRMLGEDMSQLNVADELNSPGGVIIETLLNMRTVSALTLERKRYHDYESALLKSEPNYRMEAFFAGVTAGFAMFVQQWINALQIWFGGYLLVNFPDRYSFSDFLIAQFGIMFSLIGLGAAFQGISDKKEVEKSAGRIFHLLDRKSAIDPLSPYGKKLD